MRILVTGDAGFIGTHLRRELETSGHETAGIDLAPGRASATQWRSRDLLDRTPHMQTSVHLDTALALFEPDVVVHLAAQVGRLFGEDDLGHTVESNATMTALVARSVAATRRPDKAPPRLVYCSTSEVYGDLAESTGWEFAPELMTIPHNLYGLSKRWGEEVSAMYVLGDAALGLGGGLQVIRPSMPYGPGLPPGRGRAAIVNMLYQAWCREPIIVHRGAERSWCWIGDAVRGIRLVLEAGEVAASVDDYRRGVGCYNVGRDDAATSMLNVARIAAALTNWDDPDIQEIDPPARQTVVKRLSTDKLRSLGWEPTVELGDGMDRTLDAMLGLGHLPAPA